MHHGIAVRFVAHITQSQCVHPVDAELLVILGMMQGQGRGRHLPAGDGLFHRIVFAPQALTGAETQAKARTIILDRRPQISAARDFVHRQCNAVGPQNAAATIHHDDAFGHPFDNLA